MNNARSTPIVSLDQVKIDINDSEFSIRPLSEFHVLTPDYWVNWTFHSDEGAVGWSRLEGNWNGPPNFSTGIDVDLTVHTPVNFYTNGMFFPFSFASMSTVFDSLETSASAFGGVTEHIILPVLTGTLMPGTYSFSLNGSGEATAWGGITFATVATPDGGSTLILMGLALGVIGILRLPKALA